MEESQGSGHDSGEVSDRRRKIESAGKLDDCPLFRGPTKVANQEPCTRLFSPGRTPLSFSNTRTRYRPPGSSLTYATPRTSLTREDS